MTFVASGCVAAGTDLIIYRLSAMVIPVHIAKGIGFFSGTTISYFNNKYITFKAKQRSITETGRFVVLYGLSAGINVSVNHIVLARFHHVLGAFISAAFVSMVLNFIGQKFWVFAPKSE